MNIPGVHPQEVVVTGIPPLPCPTSHAWLYVDGASPARWERLYPQLSEA